MVLELIAIGGVIYYYHRKNKVTKAKKAAFAAGQPWLNKDGTLTYPVDYPGLPPYTPMTPGANTNTYNRQPPMGDYKRQVPESNSMPMTRSVSIPVQTQEEYRDEKAPLVVETREAMNEKY